MSGERRVRLLTRSARGRLTLAATVVLVVAGGAIAAYLYEKHRTGNIYHPHAPFVPQPVAHTLP